MSSRLVKICLRPGCPNKYNEDSKFFEREYCQCAAPLIVKREEIVEINNVFGTPEGVEQENKTNESVVDPNVRQLFVLDHCGGIHFNLSKEEKLINEDRIVIYVGGHVYKEVPIEYDEMIIGRKSVLFEPDVDLTEIDLGRKTSRRHLMIYRRRGKYFARKLSSNKSVHIERTALAEGTDCELKDGDLIILSRQVVMIYREGK